MRKGLAKDGGGRPRQRSIRQSGTQVAAWPRVGAWSVTGSGGATISLELIKMLGATMSDVTAGLPALLSNVADEDRQNLSEYIRSLGDAGPEAPFDFRVLRPSGSVAWLRQHAPLEGHPSAGDKTAVVTDVTDEVTAARRLVFSEASLASVQDAHLGTWRVDMATRTLGVSTELRGWFGSDRVWMPLGSRGHLGDGLNVGGEVSPA